MIVIRSNSERDTEQLGAALAESLPSGSVIALIGTLGAGKTRLVQAVAAALGVPAGSVTSPTFVLVNEYRGGRLPVYHFDTYRLKDEDEFLALGPEEYFESNGLTFVEWADRFPDLLPNERVEVRIDVVGETMRRITIESSSPELDEAIMRSTKARGLA